MALHGSISEPRKSPEFWLKCGSRSSGSAFGSRFPKYADPFGSGSATLTSSPPLPHPGPSAYTIYYLADGGGAQEFGLCMRSRAGTHRSGMYNIFPMYWVHLQDAATRLDGVIPLVLAHIGYTICSYWNDPVQCTQIRVWARKVCKCSKKTKSVCLEKNSTERTQWAPVPFCKLYRHAF